MTISKVSDLVNSRLTGMTNSKFFDLVSSRFSSTLNIGKKTKLLPGHT